MGINCTASATWTLALGVSCTANGGNSVALGNTASSGTFTNTDRRVQLAREVIKPPGDARQDLWIIQEIARRMGLPWNYSGPADVFTEMTEVMPSLKNITWERLVREGAVTYPVDDPNKPGNEIIFTTGFPTESGRGKIVPARVLSSVGKFAAEATSPVELRIAEGKNHMGFATQVGEYQVQVFARLIEGQYPNYEQVIPKDNARDLTVSRPDLVEAVDIVASHADSTTQQIRFSLRDGRFTVSSATPDFGAGEQNVEAEYKGEDMEIGYNAKYLLQILRNIPTERIVFKLKTALSAGVVEPVGALPQTDEELLCLIMPLRLPDAVG